MRESKIEKKVAAPDELALKFVSPGNTGVPDRLCLREVLPEHREIVARYVRFVEVKRPGKVLEPKQVYWQERLTRMGFRHEVFNGT